MTKERLRTIAAELGSDCPFFIDSIPSMMSGRGEVLEALPVELSEALRGQRVVLFKPDFAINTALAYNRLNESRPSVYEPLELAANRLTLFKDTKKLEGLLHNTFEGNLGPNYLAIPSLLTELRLAGFACLMSGSGSCCFALAQDAGEVSRIRTSAKRPGARAYFLLKLQFAEETLMP